MSAEKQHPLRNIKQTDTSGAERQAAAASKKRKKSKTVQKVFIGAVSGLVVIILALSGLEFLQNARLNAWAQSIVIKPDQRKAMEKIWMAYQSGKAPKEDPLASLSRDDRMYIRKICSEPFRPQEFGKVKTFPYYKYEQLREQGFDTEQIDVIIGMTNNRVARPDL